MAYLITIPETRTDPRDVTIHTTTEEVTEAVIDHIKADGYVGHTITLVDDYTEEDIEIEVSEWLDKAELEELEEKYA